jgi:acyl-homoserine lactone acylase PvdQ
MLLDALGDDFAFLVSGLTIDPSRFPVAEGLAANDPRANLPGFPRHGDHLNVDAGDPGLGGTNFDYDSGPVFRMVISLGPDGMEGQNVLPGGQSGLEDDPTYDDQAKLWLGNEALPMWFEVDEVVAAATGRETLSP